MKKTTIIAFLLVACMATMCFVGGTFAKYTSTFSATDTATVAKWVVSAANLKEGVAQTVDIFATIADDGELAAEPLEDDENVDNGKLIAPGTGGKFNYVLSNDSEVAVTITSTHVAEEAGVPIEWSLTGAEDSWKDDINQLNLDKDAAPIAKGATETITIYWRWAFVDESAKNISDTALGTAWDGGDQATPSLTITVTFNQVD